jgi:hypothetical protein
MISQWRHWRRASGGASARKWEVVLRLMQGEHAEGLSRLFGLPVSKLQRWRERAISMRGASQPG